MSQKYTIVHFFSPIAPSTNFSGSLWPLHTTLLDMFILGGPLQALTKGLTDLASLTAPFDVIADKDAFFGPNRDVLVTLLRPSEAMTNIHEALLQSLQELSPTFDHPEYVGTGFVPHATVQKDDRLGVGQAYTIQDFSLVDMYPNNDISRRAILATLPLSR